MYAGDARIAAYDKLSVTVNASPTSSGYAITLDSYARVTGLFGNVRAESDITYNDTVSSSTATVDFSGNTDIVGRVVSINAYSFSAPVYVHAHGVRRALAKKVEAVDPYFARNKTDGVNKADYHIGGGAAGIYVEIDENGAVHSSGNENLVSYGSILSKLSNSNGGSLNGVNVSFAGARIFNAQFLPCVTVVIRHATNNYTIGDITTYYDTLGGISARSGNLQGRSESSTPVVQILSYGSGSITLGGVILNQTGSTRIAWLGDGMGALLGGEVGIGNGSAVTVAPLWTNSLRVENAASIGTAASPLAVYLNDYAPGVYARCAKPTVDANADGDIYLKLLRADVIPMVDPSTLTAAAAQSFASGGSADVQLGRIVSGTGLVDIELPKYMCVAYKPGGSSLSVYYPGQTAMLTDSFKATSGRTFTLNELADLMTGSGQMLAYTLPNGAMLYLDADTRELLRITSGTKELNAYSYGYDSGTLIIYDNGSIAARLVLDSGVLTVDSDYEGEFVAYIDYDDGWKIDTGNAYIKTATGYDYISTDTAPYTKTLWYVDGTIHYYFIGIPEQYTDDIDGTDNRNYIMVVDEWVWTRDSDSVTMEDLLGVYEVDYGTLLTNAEAAALGLTGS